MPLTSREIKIAVIDDDEDDFMIITDYLRAIEGNKFTIDWCRDFKKALEIVENKSYDVYLVDYRLGKNTGLELLEALDDDYFEPIILLTGKGNKDIDVKAMHSGATDYLIKSELNTEKLERCIRYSLEQSYSLKELKARENKYRNLFEGSKDAVFITNSNLDLLEYNAVACQMFGCKESNAQPNLYKLIKETSQRHLLARLLKHNHNVNDLELDIVSGDMDARPCLLSITVLESAEGEPLLYGILHDITNIRKAEAANIQAQKLAANERLMRVLAHEIRNPLNNISLSADQLEMEDEDTELKSNLLEIIKRNCIRINHIISELLDLTKPAELTFQRHTLQEIVDESIAMTSDRINLNKITVKRNYPENPLEISANKSKLMIAFTNILVNAIEAMEAGKGLLNITMNALPEYYQVSIKDNGRGIPEEYLSKLFEPFFTLKKNGIGLGLAASYSIIQSHKAVMQVESRENAGTNFIISFNRNNGENSL